MAHRSPSEWAAINPLTLKKDERVVIGEDKSCCFCSRSAAFVVNTKGVDLVYLCKRHFIEQGKGLGTGLGRRIIYR